MRTGPGSSGSPGTWPRTASARPSGGSAAWPGPTGLRCVHPGPSARTTIRDSAARAGLVDLVERDFTAPAPDQLWVGDITYIWTLSGFSYLATLIDMFSNKVVGWAVADHMRTELVAGGAGERPRRPEAPDRRPDRPPRPRLAVHLE